MPWHPPIPSNKLYSEPALRLGPALAMLIWCYDGIERDGTIEVSLEKAAQDFGKPYRTVKDWWKQLREGPFFVEQHDRGHKGWKVKMSSEWVDWRIMQHNYPDTQGQDFALEDEPSSPDEGQDFALEDAQGPLKARSRPAQGRNNVLEGPAYKVLHDDQESSDQREREDRDGTARSLTESPAVEVYRQAFPQVRLTRTQIAFIANLVGDGVEQFNCWRAAIQDYELSPHWKPENLGNLKDRFERKLKDRANEQKQTQSQNRLPPTVNGTKPNFTDSPVDRKVIADMARKAMRKPDESS